MQAQINIRALKAIAIAAPTDNARPYLNGVFVEINASRVRMTATDGYRAIVLEHEHPEGDNAAIGDWSGIVPASLITRVKIGKGTPAYSTLAIDGARVAITIDGGGLSDDCIDATYPDYRHVMPSGEASGVPATFNPDYIASFYKAARIIHTGRGEPPIPVIAHNGENPTLVDWLRAPPEGTQAIGVLMPIRGTVEITKTPAWVNA